MHGARGSNSTEAHLRLRFCCKNSAAHPKTVYTYTAPHPPAPPESTVPMCNMQLCPMLRAANTSSLFLAVVDAKMIFPSPHAAGHEEVDVIFGGEKCGCPAHSSSSWFSLVNAQISLAGIVKGLGYCRDKCADPVSSYAV